MSYDHNHYLDKNNEHHECEEPMHYHDIEGGYILHADHDLGEGIGRLDPIPYEGHQHILALIKRNYINEISGPAYRSESTPAHI